MKIGDYETHPAADMFPMMHDGDLESLEADIGDRGLIDPITLIEVDAGYGNGTKRQMVLDGRNRLKACLLAKVEPRFHLYDGTEPYGFAVAKNRERRHLTPSQYAACVTAALPALREEASKRQATSTGGATPQLGAEVRQAAKGKRAPKSSKAAAATVGVSARLVEDAAAVAKRDPELLEHAKSGRVSVGMARKITEIGDQPAREKAKSAIDRGDVREAREVIKEHPRAATARKKMPGLNVDSVLTRLAAMRRETMGAWPWRGDATAVVAVLREWADEIEGGTSHG